MAGRNPCIDPFQPTSQAQSRYPTRGQNQHLPLAWYCKQTFFYFGSLLVALNLKLNQPYIILATAFNTSASWSALAILLTMQSVSRKDRSWPLLCPQ